jgi:fumarylacetoacetase
VPLADLPRTARPPQDPQPLPYLEEPAWALDLPLELELNGTVVSRTNADQLYWSVAQQVAHLTSNGASLRAGDLLGSGTISGPERDQRGCLLELSWNGAEPITLAGGETRTFLEDGDEAVLRSPALGEVRGRVVPSGR